MREPQVCICNGEFPSLGFTACLEVMYFEREEVTFLHVTSDEIT